MVPPAPAAPSICVPDEPGSRYRIVRSLGSGATGAVYEAMDRVTGDAVALKVLEAERGPWPPPAWRTLSRLEHPALPRLHAWGVADGVPWVARDLARGVPLTELLGRFDEEELFALAARLVSLLDHLHRNGVLHGDIKPDNIIVDRDPRLGVWPQLIDFGLAVESADPRSREARGSIPWMAPELLAGQGVGPQTDRYSLAMSLVAAATGAPPYPAEDDQLIARIARREVLETLDAVPRSIRAALTAALAGELRPAAWHALQLATDDAGAAPVRLVERAGEAAALRDIEDGLAADTPGTVVRFVGPLGSGRRTLARQAVASVRWSVPGVTIVPVGATGPGILEALSASEGASARAVPDPRHGDVSSAVAAAIEARRDRPTAVLVTTDALSFDLAREIRVFEHALARAGATCRFALVIANAEDVDAEIEHGVHTRIHEVGALSEAEATRVLVSAGIESDARLAELLEVSQGRVGYLRMLVDASDDPGDLPTTLQGVVGDRIARLTPQLKHTLACVVLWDRPVSPGDATRLGLSTADLQALVRAGLLARGGAGDAWRVADTHVRQIVRDAPSDSGCRAVLDAMDEPRAGSPAGDGTADAGQDLAAHDLTDYEGAGLEIIALELATRIGDVSPARVHAVLQAAPRLDDPRRFGRAIEALAHAPVVPTAPEALEALVEAWIRHAVTWTRTSLVSPGRVDAWVARLRDAHPAPLVECIQLLDARERALAGHGVDVDHLIDVVGDRDRPARARRLAGFALCLEVFERGLPGVEGSAESFVLQLTDGLTDERSGPVPSPTDRALAIAVGFGRCYLMYDRGQIDAMDDEVARMRRLGTTSRFDALRLQRQAWIADAARAVPTAAIDPMREAVEEARQNGWLDLEVELVQTLIRRADSAPRIVTRRDIAREAWQLGLRARRHDLVLNAIGELIAVYAVLGDADAASRALDDLTRQLPADQRDAVALRIGFHRLVAATVDPDPHVWVRTLEGFEAEADAAGLAERLAPFVRFRAAGRALFDGDFAALVAAASEVVDHAAAGTSLRAWGSALLGYGAVRSGDRDGLTTCLADLDVELAERRLVLWREVLRAHAALGEGNRAGARRHGAAAVAELESLLDGLDGAVRDRALAMPWARAVTEVEAEVWGHRNDQELVDGMRTILEISRETIFVGGGYERRLGEALRRIAEFAGAARGTVYRVERAADGEVAFAPALSWPDATHEVRASRTVLGQVADQRQTVLSPNALEDTRFSTAGSVLQLGLRSVLAIPLAVGESLLGIVWLDHPDKVDRFTAARRTLIELLADQLAAILEEARGREDVQAVRADFPDVVGESVALAQTLQRASKAAATDSPVLILGETGTGKELLARGMHANSRRADAPFVPVNCAAIPSELFEAELFGAVRGAYTGANRDREGLIEAASGGTLFLDEVGELPEAVQAKLLRVLEDGTWRRVGEVRERRLSARIIAATNRDLAALSGQGRFREDLYYRLAILSVTLPPLRDRPEDIPRLAGWFHRLFAERYGRRLEPLSAGAVRTLMTVDWPGNVRQLRNVMEQCVVFAEGDRVGAEDILANLASKSDPRMRPTLARAVAFEPEMSFADEVDGFKRWLAEQALSIDDGNRTRAARRLGINRRTLYKILPADGPDGAD